MGCFVFLFAESGSPIAERIYINKGRKMRCDVRERKRERINRRGILEIIVGRDTF